MSTVIPTPKQDGSGFIHVQGEPAPMPPKPADAIAFEEKEARIKSLQNHLHTCKNQNKEPVLLNLYGKYNAEKFSGIFFAELTKDGIFKNVKTAPTPPDYEMAEIKKYELDSAQLDHRLPADQAELKKYTENCMYDEAQRKARVMRDRAKRRETNDFKIKRIKDNARKGAEKFINESASFISEMESIILEFKGQVKQAEEFIKSFESEKGKKSKEV
jgi:hypothetical protein